MRSMKVSHLNAKWRVNLAIAWATLFLAALVLLMVLFWTATGLARASCDPGQYYDPTHQICQGSAPAYPQPGYGPWQNNYPGIPTNPPPGGWTR